MLFVKKLEETLIIKSDNTRKEELQKYKPNKKGRYKFEYYKFLQPIKGKVKDPSPNEAWKKETIMEYLKKRLKLRQLEKAEKEAREQLIKSRDDGSKNIN